MSDATHLPVLPMTGAQGKVEALKEEIRRDRETGHAASPTPASPQTPPVDVALKLIEGKVIAALRQVYDPEIPVNIYDLGLIYEIKVDPTTHAVDVKMTLTAPGCPVAGTLPGEVERKIETVDEVPSARVELVWEPQWTKDRMSESALLELGF